MEYINKPIRVVNCPLNLEVCFTSCYWRKGDRCYFLGKKGTPIKELKSREEMDDKRTK